MTSISLKFTKPSSSLWYDISVLKFLKLFLEAVLLILNNVEAFGILLKIRYTTSLIGCFLQY